MTRPARQEPPSEAVGRPPEAAGLPETLSALAVILPRLADALDRQADRGPEPLAYRKVDAAGMCGMSTRLWERLLSAGKAPRPDAYAGKCPLWTRATLEAWIARGGSK